MGKINIKKNYSVSKPKTYTKNFSVVELSTYQMPKAVERKGDNWVTWGEDNDYFGRLIDLNLGSPTNSRCIKGISDMIYGRGLDCTDSDDKPVEWAEAQLIFKPKDVKRIVNDRKELGMAAIQVVYNKTKKTVLKALHFPIETLRAEKAVDGIIKAWYYHPNWSEYKNGDKPKRIPAFGQGSKKETSEIFVSKPYQSGFWYYTPSDYHGCLQYCDLEVEVSNYHINNIKNGLQPSLFINFNNGIPPEETQEIMESKINDKFGGTNNAGRTIIAFNEDKDSAATIDPIHLPDAHAQYQFLADESREKIMLGHGIVSPILLGIKDNTGFGNNAEELRTASILMDNYVIRPFQTDLLDDFCEILSINGIYLNLYFVTLQPIEFTELENISTKIKREEETGEKLSSQTELEDFKDEDGDDLLSQLEGLGEVISDDWELIHSEEVSDAEKDFNLTELANIENKPNAKSSQDSDVYKVRYAYSPVRQSTNSRKFCQSMETFTSRNMVFRKEDINMMSFRGVNKELGHNKQNYSLLKFKGGKNCKHSWELRVYKKKVSKGNEVSEEDAIKDGLKQPKNPSETPIRPYDMPDRGAYPTNKK